MKPGVIRARVHLEIVPSPDPPRPKPSSLDVLGTILLLGMLAVTGLHLLQALVRQQVEYFSLLGLQVLTVLGSFGVFVLAIILMVAIKDVSHRHSGRRMVRMASRLAEESDAGEHGEPAAARGTAGWLTAEGIILTDGRRFAWTRVRVPELYQQDDQLWVRAELRSLERHRFIQVAVGYGLIAALALGAVVSAALAFGFLGQRGFRYDLATVVSLSVLMLMICGFGLTFHRFLSKPNSTRLEIAVLRSRISPDELQDLLDQYLRRA